MNSKASFSLTYFFKNFHSSIDIAIKFFSANLSSQMPFLRKFTYSENLFQQTKVLRVFTLDPNLCGLFRVG